MVLQRFRIAAIGRAKGKTIFARPTVGAEQDCIHELQRWKIGVNFDIVRDATGRNVYNARSRHEDIFLRPDGTWRWEAIGDTQGTVLTAAKAVLRICLSSLRHHCFQFSDQFGWCGADTKSLRMF